MRRLGPSGGLGQLSSKFLKLADMTTQVLEKFNKPVFEKRSLLLDLKTDGTWDFSEWFQLTRVVFN
jgi:hypothetical protein